MDVSAQKAASAIGLEGAAVADTLLLRMEEETHEISELERSEAASGERSIVC